jgi:hypothetical protein
MGVDEGFYVAAPSVTDAGRSLVGMVGEVRWLKEWGPVTAAAVALPGSATAYAADELVATWSAALTGVANGLVAHMASLMAAAHDYGFADTEAFADTAVVIDTEASSDGAAMAASPADAEVPDGPAGVRGGQG